MKKNKEKYLYSLALVVLLIVECVLAAFTVPHKEEIMMALLGILGGIGFLPTKGTTKITDDSEEAEETETSLEEDVASDTDSDFVDSVGDFVDKIIGNNIKKDSE